MLLKAKDNLNPRIQELEELLKLSISISQRDHIERERATLQSGARAEHNAAFEIDFRLKDHSEWVVIHDLRLEHKGRVAQIDHLVLHPNWEFYVLETKGIRSKLKIEGGRWCFLQNNHWRGMPSPIEQNARHIQVLQEVLNDFDWLPRTLGIAVVPRFINVVLVPSDCLIHRQEDLTWVVPMDQFVSKARRDFSLPGILRNIVHNHSGTDARALGEKLVSLHQPFQIDYRTRFGIKPTPPEDRQPPLQPTSRHCDGCKGPLSNAERSYCREHETRFAGQLLCRKCQTYTPAGRPTTMPTAGPEIVPRPKVRSANDKPPSRCAECGAAVDEKVVAFCRFNSTRFGKQTLCRSCQGTAVRGQSTAPAVAMQQGQA